MQFRVIRKGKEQAYFEVQDQKGASVLTSPTFFSQESCLAAIRGFVDRLLVSGGVRVGQESGQHYFEIIDEVGEVWMQSVAYSDEDFVYSLLRDFQAQAKESSLFEVKVGRQVSDKKARNPAQEEPKTKLDLDFEDTVVIQAHEDQLQGMERSVKPDRLRFWPWLLVVLFLLVVAFFYFADL